MIRRRSADDADRSVDYRYEKGKVKESGAAGTDSGGFDTEMWLVSSVWRAGWVRCGCHAIIHDSCGGKAREQTVIPVDCCLPLFRIR